MFTLGAHISLSFLTLNVPTTPTPTPLHCSLSTRTPVLAAVSGLQLGAPQRLLINSQCPDSAVHTDDHPHLQVHR